MQQVKKIGDAGRGEPDLPGRKAGSTSPGGEAAGTMLERKSLKRLTLP